MRCELYPPVPAGLARRAGMERGQVLVQSDDRRSLQTFLPLWRAELEQLAERRVRWSIDVDPLELCMKGIEAPRSRRVILQRLVKRRRSRRIP